MKQKFDFKKYLIIFIIATGTTVMYGLPYLKSTFYDPMREALGLTHQQLGNLLSVYGLLATFLYFPGGWLADKFSAKKLLSFSLIASGLIGFYFSTYPSYNQLMLIFVLWGITTILTFWAASMKVIRMLGDESEQGKLFGFNEGFSGISGVIVSFIGLYLFKVFSDVTIGFKYVVLLYSSLSILSGILVYVFIKEKTVEGAEMYSIKMMLNSVKMPKAWLIGLTIFSTYMIFSSLTYLNPYLKDSFKISMIIISALAIIRTYAIKMGVSPLAGIIVDKIGSTTKVLFIGFFAIAACELIYLITPRQPNLVWVAVITMLILSILLFGFRGIYFATVAESNIPLQYTGAVIGFASFIGFSPDAFFYTLVGGWLDKYGEKGYTYMFMLCFACALLGVISSGLLYKINAKEKVEQAFSDAV